MISYPKLANDKNVFNDILKNCDNFLFDCDGVLWQGSVAIDGLLLVFIVFNKLYKIGSKISLKISRHLLI